MRVGIDLYFIQKRTKANLGGYETVNDGANQRLHAKLSYFLGRPSRAIAMEFVTIKRNCRVGMVFDVPAPNCSEIFMKCTTFPDCNHFCCDQQFPFNTVVYCNPIDLQNVSFAVSKNAAFIKCFEKKIYSQSPGGDRRRFTDTRLATIGKNFNNLFDYLSTNEMLVVFVRHRTIANYL